MIEDIFRRAEQAGEDGVFSRINDTHPVDLFLGLESGRRAIMVVCQDKPPEPPSLAALHVESRLRPPAEWALIIRLERPDFAGLFTRLAEDLAEATIASRPAKAGEVVVGRLVRWQRMFSRRVSILLDDNELRGLAAEVSFLLDEAIPAVGATLAVDAWIGPFGAPKDFDFHNVEVEVKSTRYQARVLRVSSLDQLTDSGRPLFLWSQVVEVDHSPSDPTHSCAALVRRARMEVASDQSASDRLEDALTAVGWEDRDEYESRVVRFGPSVCYAVGEGFPRIQRPAAPAGVTDCQYSIDIAALGPHTVATWRVSAHDGT